MQTIQRKDSVLSMSAANPPAARAASGDTVVFETSDCFSNEIRRPDRIRAVAVAPPGVKPWPARRWRAR